MRYEKAERRASALEEEMQEMARAHGKDVAALKMKLYSAMGYISIPKTMKMNSRTRTAATRSWKIYRGWLVFMVPSRRHPKFCLELCRRKIEMFV